MPDSLSPVSPSGLSTRGLSLAERVSLLRRPLPSHVLPGSNFRRWAVAVCDAEVRHRDADFARVERALGFSIDRWDEPKCTGMGQYKHEACAGVALLWLSHLQTHESEKRTPFSFVPWCDWKRESRAAWLTKRRELWAGFLTAVRAYVDARKEAGL